MSTACWREIGVGGDRSCPELVEHVHCRNCPVHQAAGRELFERPVPDGYRAQWTHDLAVAPPSASGSRSFLVFRLGAEWLALRALACSEVSEVRPAHVVPHRSRRLLAGIINVRGRLLPFVHLHNLLGAAAAVDDDEGRALRPRLVVLGEDERSWAFVADEVAGVVYFPDDAIGEVPATVAAGLSPYVVARASFHERTVGLLDADRLTAALDGGALEAP